MQACYKRKPNPIFREVVISVTPEDVTALMTDGIITINNSGIDGCRLVVQIDSNAVSEIQTLAPVLTV